MTQVGRYKGWAVRQAQTLAGLRSAPSVTTTTTTTTMMATTTAMTSWR
jgi:hypothetical protein